MNDACTKLLAASTMVWGAAGALFPDRVLDTAGRFLLAGYENPEDLEPAEWYVSAVRLQGAVTALAGAVVLALEYGRGCGRGDGESDDEREA